MAPLAADRHSGLVCCSLSMSHTSAYADLALTADGGAATTEAIDTELRDCFDPTVMTSSFLHSTRYGGP